MNNMKPTDVRKGNCVEYDNRIFRIDTISDEFPTLDTSEFGVGVVDWQNLNPVKINECPNTTLSERRYIHSFLHMPTLQRANANSSSRPVLS